MRVKSFETVFSNQQKTSFKESTAKINIWQGSVRSGKTYISLWRFLKEITDANTKMKDGEFVLLARTFDSIKRNVLPILQSLIGDDMKFWYGKREMYIWGRLVHLIGCDDERAETKIRGMTALGAYVDEATIIPESVIKMLVSRCAMGDARIFMTTNPDSPFHFIKKDFIDNNPDVKSWKFTLDDNPLVTEETKDYLKRQYKGLWYQRFILGEWVMASGAVYDFFDQEVHVVKESPGVPLYSIVAIDYGTTNATAFLLISFFGSKYPKIVVEQEYYWDSKERQRQKTDSEYAEDLLKFVKNKNIYGIYLDPSATSFRTELIRVGLKPKYASNEVIEGIRYTADMISGGAVKIRANCVNLIRSLQNYTWDPKSQSSGQDRPLKIEDHLPDALRYGIFSHFYKKSSEKVDWEEEFKKAFYENSPVPNPFQIPDPNLNIQPYF